MGKQSGMLGSTTGDIILVIAAGVVTSLVTGLVIRNARALGLVQAPNARSSHARPTPSGGGIGIVCGTATIGLWAAWTGGTPLLAILAAAVAVAMLGLADDLRDLPASLRLVVQTGVVAGLLLSLSPLPPVDLAGFAIAAPLVAAVLLVAGLWWVNLFNFMDGIDGLAASEAVFVLLAGALLCWYAAGQMPAAPLWWWMIGGAAAAIGFLVHNWPPARIFMGDVGSNHLAILIFGLAVASAAASLLDLWVWGTLVALFVSDASVTLLRRLVRRVLVFDAHREHAYQRLARRWGHRQATLAFLAANIVWVLPMAFLGVAYPSLAWLFCLIAYGPPVICALLLGAGKPE